MRQLNIKQTKNINKTEKLSKKQIKELNLIGHIEKIVEQARDSKLSTEFYEKVKPHTDYVSKALDLTIVQSVLISLFINNSDYRRIELKDLSRAIGCANITIIRLMNDIDVLVAKQYIRSRKRESNYHFSVPIEFIDAVRKEVLYTPVQYDALDKDSLFIVIERLLKMSDEGECSFHILVNDLTYIIENNQQIEFCKKINQYRYDDNAFVILVTFCSLLVNNDDNIIGFDQFIELIEDKREQRRIRGEMQQGMHSLMTSIHNMIEFNCDDGFENHEYFRLTKKAREELLSDYKILNKEINTHKEFLTPASLVKKELYYNEREAAQVNRLESLLQIENFKNVQSYLKESGMRKGFACLFYGLPGTGKTETVYQIARKTGRDIMVVNVSQIKSCWIGESEKNIKALFDRYRNYCLSAKVTPILLFNEADAVIGIRKEEAQRAVDKMENSIQNIILQEMETLDGIMIATTNLSQNLDKAFDRRFLYKIEFENPLIEAKMAIWQSTIPSLSNLEVADLARSYDFNGGQIENIARKRAVEAIISGVEPTLETLHSFCNEENLYKTEGRKKVGFLL